MARRSRSDRATRPIAHVSLVDRVTSELRASILTGEIQPGSSVSIVELCELYDVSHIPVREALRRLESEGIVSLRPGRSALVAALSPEDLADIYRLRRLIEGDLAVKAARSMTEERLADAEQALEEYAAIEREPATLAAAHHAFHETLLLDVMGNVDRNVLELLWHSADRYLHLLMKDLDHAPETKEQRIDEHRELLELARDGKAAAFKKSWIAHLDASERSLMAALGSRDVADSA
ncbi:GntR family transcriptional regulator [Mumia sp. zg.B53]|uniref:GntR family transcriptional regulator n=1 Tax=unclassified Mumia TaxID=2621872 RepID=UPI001C6DF6D8|nr:MULTISPECIES: GntR family transcriptional regulator [unclassified Mumia]MBW9205580.1 GntR family transcriptional regulator [Mumia sp. zg.B17]MBW9208419.1 GntR family transcriptional regulator [Mumia sp. zg.B21]MBW9216376.1 GntR family transcriptional regulator [Mumia sp. zg.B53]MDD9349620.1 GntR family transcriptional regulator [Mumia sp.]